MHIDHQKKDKTTLIVTAITGTIVALVVFLFIKHINAPAEEPFSLTEGISIWPTEIIRLLAAIFSMYFLMHSVTNLRLNTEVISDEFNLKINETKENAFTLFRHSIDDAGRAKNMKIRKICSTILDYNWDVEKNGKELRIDDVWREYVRRNSKSYRWFRIALIITIYFILCFLIIRSFDRPVTPVRGTMSSLIDRGVLILSVFSFIVLNFFVFDVTRVCWRFIILAGKTHQWSPESIKGYFSDPKIKGNKIVEELMLINLIANRTEAVGRLIFYPFIIWFILFIARIDYFDNWYLPMGLVIVLSLGAIYAWSSAFVLRRASEQTRSAVIDRLTKKMAENLSENPENQPIVKQIEFVLEEVRANNKGAFAPFTQHPVLQAVLIPFGGVGSFYLIDFLAKLNI